MLNTLGVCDFLNIIINTINLFYSKDIQTHILGKYIYFVSCQEWDQKIPLISVQTEQPTSV